MTRRSIAFAEFTPSGGLFQFAVQLGEALAEQGNEVHMFTGPRPELTTRHPRFTIHPVLPTWHPMDGVDSGRLVRKLRRAVRAGQLLLAWLLLLARLRRQQPDVVLWSNMPNSVYAVGVLLADRLLSRSRLGIISHEPQVMNWEESTRPQHGLVLDRALPAAWRRMGVVFVLGEQAKGRVLERWEPNGPIIVIPHGDETALRNGHPAHPVADTGPVILFFGTWTTYKGIDVLFAALPEVRRQVPDARLVLAGAPVGMDLPALLRRAAEIGGVDARPGYVPREAVPELFNQARVVVTPYLRASQSGVIHLAYTFERPVVATTVGDLGSVVRDGETGLLVPPADPAALAQALVTLLIDPQRAQQLGKAGAVWLAEEASWPRVAEQVQHGLDQAESADAGSPGARA